MGHEVAAVRVTKRWWQCEACGWRLHTLRERFPSKRCPKCRDPSRLFRPAPAHAAPKPPQGRPALNADGSASAGAVAERGALLPRGVEHGFCLDSLAS
jgi:predicted RNA-binding Zn-ribbon protein involved in translation (DUF1610 family)